MSGAAAPSHLGLLTHASWTRPASRVSVFSPSTRGVVYSGSRNSERKRRQISPKWSLFACDVDRQTVAACTHTRTRTRTRTHTHSTHSQCAPAALTYHLAVLSSLLLLLLWLLRTCACVPMFGLPVCLFICALFTIKRNHVLLIPIITGRQWAI